MSKLLREASPRRSSSLTMSGHGRKGARGWELNEQDNSRHHGNRTHRGGGPRKPQRCDQHHGEEQAHRTPRRPCIRRKAHGSRLQEGYLPQVRRGPAVPDHEEGMHHHRTRCHPGRGGQDPLRQESTGCPSSRMGGSSVSSHPPTSWPSSRT